jgi:predicted DNA-binding transcriptional regulator AlpA
LANLSPIERKSEDVYLTPEEVAEKLKITKSTLWAWDKSGITKPLRIGKLKRYRISELDAVFERIPSANVPRRIKKN